MGVVLRRLLDMSNPNFLTSPTLVILNQLTIFYGINNMSWLVTFLKKILSPDFFGLNFFLLPFF